MKRFSNLLVIAAVAASMCHPAQAASPNPTSWELAGQFNATANGGGAVWNYGWKPYNAVGQFNAFTTPANFLSGSLLGWMLPTTQNIPQVVQHQGLVPLPASNTLTYPARAVAMHPGASCEMASVRFTPPGPGFYRVSGQFYGLDANGGGTRTLVQIVRVSTQPNVPPQYLHTGALNYPAVTQQSFTSKQVMLGTNDRLDFDVRCGAGGNYYFGSTGVHAVIERIGEYCTGTGNESNC